MSPDADASAWSRIAPYVDRALELEPRERDTWLADLTSTDPQIAGQVRAFLAEIASLDARGFLLRSQASAAAREVSWAGTRIGAYTLEERIGRGGMGEVWLARRSDGRYEGRAAVKLLDAALLGRPAEQRFVREGSLLAELRHPNIAQLIDAGVAPSGEPYLVLEYIDGERIDHYAQQQGLDVEARVRLFLDVLAAVAHAHNHLVVHRDLKPSNILVTRSGVVKLLDFGVAALLAPAVAELTRESDPGLTPGYAAPEQLLGLRVTTATDVHALGVVLFLLLTGRHPFIEGHESGAELARATIEHQPPQPSAVAADPRRARALRGDLDNIVAKALQKDPLERYATAAALALDLERFLARQPVSARPDSLGYRVSRFVRRHRSGVATAAIVLLLLLGATVVVTLQMIEAQRQRDAALYESRRAEFQARFAYQIMSEVGDDGPVTIQNLMEKGIEVLERNYAADDPRFVIGMLVNMSGRYMDIDDTAGELAALTRAEHIARRLGDPDLIAFVQCNTVETELAAGQPARAAERMRDGLDSLRKVPNPSPQRLRECGLAEARLRWAEGKVDDGIVAATRVANGMEARGETGALGYITAASTLELMLGDAGRHREALDWNRRASDANERAGRGATMSQHLTRHNEANHRYELGAPRAALEIQRAVVQRIAAQQGNDGVPPSIAQRLGFYEVRVEESAAGMELLDRGVAAAAPKNRLRIRALLDRASASLSLGRLDPALQDLTEVERLLAENPTDVQYYLRAARLLRAQWQFARGDPSASLAEVDGLLTDIGYPRTRTAKQLAAMLTLKSRAELALGRVAAAAATAQSAVTIAEAMSLDPQSSASVGAALMALAGTQRALGDSSNAKAAAQRAGQALAAALGPDHSQTRAAVSFALQK
ncbi:MAG TPA: serine/threonine-protein kinase [Steroidobacteraceae bacterium]|nr:serine/threonine-protein kinase [Steroidobacteraceae bacterium]